MHRYARNRYTFLFATKAVLKEIMTDQQFISTLLRDSGSRVREYYSNRGAVAVSSKGEVNNLLTEADLAAQRLIVAAIREAYPDDTIVAEEEGMNVVPPQPAGRVWFVDPIDGTQNFVRGMFPHFGVSIAVADSDGLLSGGVYFPIPDDLFLATRGEGAMRNGKPVRCGSNDDLNTARIDIDFSTQNHRQETIDTFSGIIVDGGQIRSHCAAVVPLCSIACDEADIYLHVALNPWDFAAGALLITEGGGRVTRLEGSPLSPFDGGRGVAATNGAIHERLIEALQVRAS